MSGIVVEWTELYESPGRIFQVFECGLSRGGGIKYFVVCRDFCCQQCILKILRLSRSAKKLENLILSELIAGDTHHLPKSNMPDDLPIMCIDNDLPAIIIWNPLVCFNFKLPRNMLEVIIINSDN